VGAIGDFTLSFSFFQLLSDFGLNIAAASQIAMFSKQLSEALFKTSAYFNILTIISMDIVFLSMTSLLNKRALQQGE
jgi:hypothetical protein